MTTRTSPFFTVWLSLTGTATTWPGTVAVTDSMRDLI